MRVIVNKPVNKLCELCNKEISLYGFSGHLKWEHKKTADDYVSIHGEYRESKNKPKSCRKVNKVTCVICNTEYSSVGMFVHIRDTHQVTKEQYVEKYGEYNPKKKKLSDVDDGQVGEFICLIDNKKFETGKQLYGYIKRTHNISPEEYVLKYIFSDIHPVCKCGCGELVNVFSHEPYKVDYVTGHNSTGETNPMFGKTHNIISIDKMVLSGNNRVEEYRKAGIPMPMHSAAALSLRGKNYSVKMMELKQRKYNVEIVERVNDFIKFKCLKCDKEHSQYHSSYFVCSVCFPPIKSKAEGELKKEIEDRFNVDCIQNYRKLFNGSLECDVFIPSKNIGIEYDGLYYHSEYSGNKLKSYHINKTNEFSKKGVKIIHVFEDEWLNKKEIVMSRIGAYLGAFSRKIYARKCVIKVVESREANEFLTHNHIQGADKHEIAYGLFHDDSLVSIMTFSKLNIAKGSSHVIGHYELSRFCNLLNTSVLGGVSRLISHFKNNIKFSKLITYADLRWSDAGNNVYIKNGFSFVSQSSPNYFYMKDHKTRLNRFGFMKSILVKNGADINKTEIQIMREMNYDRIWDCGHLKYEMVIKEIPQL